MGFMTVMNIMWPLNSRTHGLNHFPKQGVACYVKRDDELSCGISGTKLRKYASIAAYLVAKKIQRLIIIAGPQSNNLLAALQVAREHGMQISVFLLKPKNDLIQGNYKLSLLFLNEKDIIWVERSQWALVGEMAQQYQTECEEACFILTEGGSVQQALPGAMTLAEDIVRNEVELALTFQHVFVDAGTGFAAAALIHGLTQLKHHALVHILLLADKKEQFVEKLMAWLGYVPHNYECFYPQTARSFGAINQQIKSEIKRLAKEEGILADPIYSAKLFHEARRVIMQEELQGNVLIIHSGGVLTMPGFDY